MGEVVVVAVDASREITGYALEWAVRNVIKAQDTLILLAILPVAVNRNNHHSGIHHFVTRLLKKWGLHHDKDDFDGDIKADRIAHKINSACIHMMNQLCSANQVTQVETLVKIIAKAEMGSVATKAQQLRAAWIILDRHLKKEGDCCLKQLSCNVILIDHAIPKILRLVNTQSQEVEDPMTADEVSGVYPPDSNVTTPLSSLGLDSRSPNTDVSYSFSSMERDDANQAMPVIDDFQPSKSLLNQKSDLLRHSVTPRSTTFSTRLSELSQVSKFDAKLSLTRHPVTPRSTTFISRSQELSLVSNFDDELSLTRHPVTLRSTIYGTRSQDLIQVSKLDDELSVTRHPITPQWRAVVTRSQELFQVSEFDDDSSLSRKNTEKNKSTSGKLLEKPPKAPILARRSVDSLRSSLSNDQPRYNTRRNSFHRPPQKDGRSREEMELASYSINNSKRTVDRTSSVRKAISLSFKNPPKPPPLCSVCKHNAPPIFGKPPRKFSYEEMERATDDFSMDNFLAEGGYGPVYKGVLPDGQVVAVKQHRVVSAQGASEFCSEIEVLSCAQHRNLVMLVGYCTDKEWLLVYEFVCNGSLDKHLYHGTKKETKEVMAWENRMKVATGTARGLRYLHEDCRVGCIIHRDLRPNNILLTHDFEPMVGDFGLARWQADGQSAEETRVIGTFGYLAPEYTQTGQITEKADVYAFGVLLMELLSGLKAIDLSRKQGQQYLPEWGRRLVEKKKIREIIDHRLDGNYADREVESMIYAASLCISTDPERRPRMSKVLRILEGDMVSDMISQIRLQTARKLGNDEIDPSAFGRSPTLKNNTRQLHSDCEVGISDDENYLANQSEDQLVSHSYQQHLHGSLEEFIDNMKANCTANGNGITLPDHKWSSKNLPSHPNKLRNHVK